MEEAELVHERQTLQHLVDHVAYGRLGKFSATPGIGKQVLVLQLICMPAVELLFKTCEREPISVVFTIN